MNFFDFFGKKDGSANDAKNRLKLMLAAERSANLPYMEAMKDEILEVIKKYTNASKLEVRANSNQDIKTLEVEITLG